MRHRSRGTAQGETERSLLEAIAAGELDDHLGALAGAVEARRQLLLTVRSATALATLCLGDVVRITERVSPRYLVASMARSSGSTITQRLVRLEHPVGRFASGRVRCPPLTLEKIPPDRLSQPSPVAMPTRSAIASTLAGIRSRSACSG